MSRDTPDRSNEPSCSRLLNEQANTLNEIVYKWIVEAKLVPLWQTSVEPRLMRNVNVALRLMVGDKEVVIVVAGRVGMMLMRIIRVI